MNLPAATDGAGEAPRSNASPPLPYEATLAAGLPRVKEVVKRLIGWSCGPLGSLVRVATREPVLAWTFDDGPDPETTPRVAELLERHGARGTFFVVGERAQAQPELLARLVAAGHAVANHSWDHPSFRRIRSADRRTQIRRCAAALPAVGAPLFRPPFAEQSLASRLDALRCGHRVVIGDVIAEDWRDDPAERIVARVLRRLRRGSIVLCHDSLYVTEEPRYRDRGPLLAALAELLERFGSAYRGVTVPELLRRGRPVRWPWYHRLPRDFHRRLS